MIRGRVTLQPEQSEDWVKMNLKNVGMLLTSVPESGGEHQYLTLLMGSVAKYDKKYFHVLAICCNRYWVMWCKKNHIAYVRYKLEEYSGFRMKVNACLPFLSREFNTFTLKLCHIVRSNRIDLLVGGQQSIFIPRLPCKVVQPVHDLMHRYESHFPEIQDSYMERERLFLCGSYIANVVLVDSELGRKQYLECYYKKRKHMPRVEILPFVAPDYRKKGQQYIDTPSRYIFYPAQFWEHKNHKNLIAAIILLKNKLPDIHLLLVGSERNTLRKIQKMIHDNMIEKNVSIKGFVSDEQIIYLYRHAVALVMPTYFGPTNIPPLEAMALGCPVIVSDRYGMREQVGDAGIFCDPDSPEDIAECIEKVWNDESLRQSMVAGGYAQVKKWSVNDFQRRFIKILLHELRE